MVIDNSVVITKGNGWGEVEDGEGEINGDGRRFDSGYSEI